MGEPPPSPDLKNKHTSLSVSDDYSFFDLMKIERYDRISDVYSRSFQCLCDPDRRHSLFHKMALVLLHLIFLGVILLIDRDFVQKTREEPWYIALYLLLFVITLIQYFFTSGSSPGYVIDVMRSLRESDSIFNTPLPPVKQNATSKDVFTSTNVENNQSISATSWAKLVMNLYPFGSSFRNLTCNYCNIVQPPRSKHCHDCDKCVLQFDHHCVWLGTCIGVRNHCRFWWYILDETTLCLWTSVLYIVYLKSNTTKYWWGVTIAILLLACLLISLVFLILLLLFHSYLALTNQTTYEFVRRKRIPYLRGMAGGVRPFSKGMCRNVRGFCWGRMERSGMERVPTQMEIEAMAIPYTFGDMLTCRCC